MSDTNDKVAGEIQPATATTVAITCKAGELGRIAQGVGQLANVTLPANLSFRVARIQRAVNAELELWGKQVNALLERHVQKNTDGTWVQSLDDSGKPISGEFELKPENRATFKDERLKLEEELIEFPKIRPIRYKDLPDKFNFRPEPLAMMGPFFELPEE